jgi:hypothetical protein
MGLARSKAILNVVPDVRGEKSIVIVGRRMKEGLMIGIRNT